MTIIPYRWIVFLAALGYWLYFFTFTSFHAFGWQFRFLTVWCLTANVFVAFLMLRISLTRSKKTWDALVSATVILNMVVVFCIGDCCSKTQKSVHLFGNYVVYGILFARFRSSVDVDWCIFYPGHFSKNDIHSIDHPVGFFWIHSLDWIFRNKIQYWPNRQWDEWIALSILEWYDRKRSNRFLCYNSNHSNYLVRGLLSNCEGMEFQTWSSKLSVIKDTLTPLFASVVFSLFPYQQVIQKIKHCFIRRKVHLKLN